MRHFLIEEMKKEMVNVKFMNDLIKELKEFPQTCEIDKNTLEFLEDIINSFKNCTKMNMHDLIEEVVKKDPNFVDIDLKTLAFANWHYQYMLEERKEKNAIINPSEFMIVRLRPMSLDANFKNLILETGTGVYKFLIQWFKCTFNECECHNLPLQEMFNKMTKKLQKRTISKYYEHAIHNTHKVANKKIIQHTFEEILWIKKDKYYELHPEIRDFIFVPIESNLKKDLEKNECVKVDHFLSDMEVDHFFSDMELHITSEEDSEVDDELPLELLNKRLKLGDGQKIENLESFLILNEQNKEIIQPMNKSNEENRDEKKTFNLSQYVEIPHGHTCNFCPKNFKTNFNLDRHISTRHKQTDELVQCNFCNKKFIVENHLKNHISSKHKQNANQATLKANAIPIDLEHKTTGPSILTSHHDSSNEEYYFKCTFCKEKLEDEPALIKHIDSKHSKCDDCGIIAKDPKFLKEHMCMSEKHS